MSANFTQILGSPKTRKKPHLDSRAKAGVEGGGDVGLIQGVKEGNQLNQQKLLL